MKIYEDLKRIAEIEFAELVDFAELLDYKLRIYFKDRSFADIWFSRKIKGRFSYHWEKGDKTFRHDNMPHPQWEKVATFPKHFHNGDQEKVEESRLSDDPPKALREFLEFIKMKIGSNFVK